MRQISILGKCARRGLKLETSAIAWLEAVPVLVRYHSDLQRKERRTSRVR